MKRLARYGLLVALAIILSYVESLIPLPFFMPGMKLGLANIVVLMALYTLRSADAVVISFMRVLLVGILFKNGVSMAYSFGGALLSLFAMILLKKGVPASSVYLKVGFKNLSHFSTAFKRQFGILPTQAKSIQNLYF